MDRQNDYGELHRIPEAAAVLKKTTKSMWGFVARGGVGVIRVGKTVYVPQSEIDRLLSDGYTPAIER